MESRFQHFTVMISSINRCIRRIKTEEMKLYDLKSPHVSCVYYLYKIKGLTAKELCDICDEDKANISRSIKYLEKKEYLYIDPQNEKRYLKPLELTKKGKEVGAYIAKRVDDILELASAGISEEERKQMYRCLDIVCNNLQAICNQYEEN